MLPLTAPAGQTLERRQRVTFHLHLIIPARAACVLVIAHHQSLAVVRQEIDPATDEEREAVAFDAQEKWRLAADTRGAGARGSHVFRATRIAEQVAHERPALGRVECDTRAMEADQPRD